MRQKLASQGNHLTKGVLISEQIPGYLLLTQDSLDRIIVREPIERFYNVEEKPFARGKSAAVRRCREMKSGRQYAAKFLKKRRRSPELKPEILHEVAVLEACRDCPRVVSLHQVFESTTETVLLLELACGGELQTLLDKDDEVPAEGQVVRLMRQILEGIVYLHSINVAHLDLKPQNVVLTGDYPNYDVKLCDFGISRHLSQNADVREILGTPDYVAPEVLNYDPISLATDMWSVGVLMYVLLTGCSPFGGDTKQETFSNITQCRLDFPEELFEEISQEAQDLMTKLMVKEPSDRLSAVECLKHPWFSKDFSDQSPASLCSTPLQRTPVPVRKEQKTSRKYEGHPPCKTTTTETLLPSQTTDEYDNSNPEVYTERITVLTSVDRTEIRLDNQPRLDNAPKVEAVAKPVEIKIKREDSLRYSRARANAMQTMPVRSVQNINRQTDGAQNLYKCTPIFIHDVDDSPPVSISGSSSGSSINAGADPYTSSSDSNSDTVSDMSIDSSSDRSSIISLDDSMDFMKGNMIRSYSSSNVWEATRNLRPMLRQCSDNFARARSVFGGKTDDMRIGLLGPKLAVFRSTLDLGSPKSVNLKVRKEQNGQTVTITEVKPVVGKKYERRTEVKCETVSSRIKKLQVYSDKKLDVF